MKEILYQGTCGLILDDLDFSGNRLQTMIISHRTAPELQLRPQIHCVHLKEGQTYIGDLLRFSEGRLYPDRHVPLAQRNRRPV